MLNKIKCFFGYHDLKEETAYNNHFKPIKKIEVGINLFTTDVLGRYPLSSKDNQFLKLPCTRVYHVVKYFRCTHCGMLIEVEYDWKGDVLFQKEVKKVDLEVFKLID